MMETAATAAAAVDVRVAAEGIVDAVGAVDVRVVVGGIADAAGRAGEDTKVSPRI